MASSFGSLVEIVKEKDLESLRFAFILGVQRSNIIYPVVYRSAVNIPDSRVVNLGTRAAEHQGCNWGMRLIDGCSLELCVATFSVASSGIAPQKYN